MRCSRGERDGGWCVIQTRPNQEEKARFNLMRQGFEVYLPRYSKRRRHARRTEVVARPLYPRYLFSRLRPDQPWRSIHSTFGVARLVESEGRPAIINDDVVAAIREREDEHGLVVLDPLGDLKAGDRVRITDGALAESLGLVERITDERRVTLLLDMLGRKVRVALAADAIERTE